MPNSKYYNQKYKQYKEEAKNLGKNESTLNKILTNLRDTFDDEVRNVNSEYEDLKSDLKKAVRHDSTFTVAADSLPGKKERKTNSDSKLSSAISSLEDELRNVGQKKRTAESNRDTNKQNYDNKKREEREAFWNSIF